MLENNQFLPDKVLDIELELSTYCNASCQLCYRNYKAFEEHYEIKKNGNKIRDLNEIKTQVKTFRNLKSIKLVGSISEPTIYPKFLELVQFLKDLDLVIEICTNGDTRTIEFWEELGRILTKEDEVYFSICGLKQSTHERYRKGTNLYQILKNAAAFRSTSRENKNDYAQCIKFKYNEDELNSKEFKEFIKDFSNEYQTETYLLKEDNNYVEPKNIKDLSPVTSKDYEKLSRLVNLKFQSGMKLKTTCMSKRDKSIQIDINGNIYPCYLFLEASKGELWDKDYNKIDNLHYDVCKFCESETQKYCAKHQMEYII